MHSTKNTVVLAGLAIAALLASGQTGAVPAQGSFHASGNCEAYTSTKTHANPGQIRLEKGHTYPNLEQNRAQEPEWFRVRIDGATPKERWVEKTCGQFESGNPPPPPPTNGGHGQHEAGGACDIAKQSDSYVLALSWQPAFCESHQDKAECGIQDPKAYQASNFTLHGLWPNKTQCGIHYGYCGEVKTKPDGFCNYPGLALGETAREPLGEVMPSVKAGSCLERHEWYKHGTCSGLTPDQYFALAARLTRQFNESGMAGFVDKHIGQEIKTQAFFDELDARLGTEAHKRVQLACQGRMLVDVTINLPNEIAPEADLKTLIAGGQASGGRAKNCGASFRIDPIGQ